MKIPLPAAVCFGLSLSFWEASSASLTVAPLFRDHAVFQQGRVIPVWGEAEPGKSVVVEWGGQKVTTRADERGGWRVDLPARDASSIPSVMRMSDGAKTIEIKNIMIGEVWLCSGQSNMAFAVRSSQGGQGEILSANDPAIRHFRVGHRAAEEPVTEAEGEWKAASPQTLGEFSAVAYFFARDLRRDLKVPIGLINASWGNTAIESWMSADALRSDPAFAVVEERWLRTKGRLAGQPLTPDQAKTQPAALFHGMIHPLIPYGIRGVIWYQGEANSGRPAEYGPLFSAMITDWRRKFEQESLPFYFVQLANFEPKTDKGGEKLAFMREAQAEALALAETGMAVTIDIGTPSNIHPPNKQDVGARLARLAKAKVYGLDITWSGPRFQSARREQGARVRVYLDDADGLQSRNEPVKAFELAGSDGRFFPAQGAIDGGTVILETPEVPDPHFVRYAWSNSPEVNLTNGEGLPAVPFKKTAVTRE